MASKEASSLIETALMEAMKSSEDYEDGDILVDWVVVAFATNPDEERGHMYPTFVANNNMPHYRVIGLLQTAVMMYEAEADKFKEGS